MKSSCVARHSPYELPARHIHERRALTHNTASRFLRPRPTRVHASGMRRRTKEILYIWGIPLCYLLLSFYTIEHPNWLGHAPPCHGRMYINPSPAEELLFILTLPAIFITSVATMLLSAALDITIYPSEYVVAVLNAGIILLLTRTLMR